VIAQKNPCKQDAQVKTERGNTISPPRPARQPKGSSQLKVFAGNLEIRDALVAGAPHCAGDLPYGQQHQAQQTQDQKRPG